MNHDELREKADRLKEINEIIKQLEPEVRAAAFALLQNYVAATGERLKAKNSSDQETATPEDLEGFFSQFNTDKPADNALLVAAYHYSQYGSAVFGVDDLKSKATEVGLIMPERVDMTIRQARRDGKSLFQSGGRGIFKPTVHGELFFKNTFHVSKGTRGKNVESASDVSATS
jgi:hypothetical protein